MSKIETIPKFAIKRKEYKPNQIHDRGLCEVIIEDDSIGQYILPSVTDKESYRITLASMRSMIKTAGSSNVGSYSLKDGVYRPELDFSYLNRKDLTIVDITNYIDTLKANLVTFDYELKEQIEEQLQKASELKELKEKENNNSSKGSDE